MNKGMATIGALKNNQEWTNEWVDHIINAEAHQKG
jgi:hypothetical protein